MARRLSSYDNNNNNQQQDSQLNEETNLVKSFYDTYYFETDLLTILKLTFYFPIGIILVLIRCLIIIFLNLLFNLIPNLKSSGYFIRYACISLGIHTIYEKDPNLHGQITNNVNNNDKLKIYVSNHITCFDYISIKSIVNKAKYFEEYSNRSLTYRSSKTLSDLISMYFVKILQSKQTKQNTDFNLDVNNYPLIVLPEQISTNGKYGLLKFDIVPFDIDKVNGFDINSIEFIPVCLNVSRPFISLSLNCIHSSDLMNVFLTLFSPITIYRVKFLKAEIKAENETSEHFAERIRHLIGHNLRIECTQLTSDNIKQIWSNYERILHNAQNRAQLQEQLHQQQLLQQRQRESNNISFSDISRLALQIKDILPDVSFETIKQHINDASTLDIDTVIASILDSNEHERNTNSQDLNFNFSGSGSNSVASFSSLPTISRSISSPPPLSSLNGIHKGVTASASSSNLDRYGSRTSLSSYKSYEERKFILLNDARRRYLSKNQI